MPEAKKIFPQGKPWKACAGAHVHHLALHFRLGGKQQAVSKVAVLDTLGAGDGRQVDLLIIAHQNFSVVIQLVQLGMGEADVPQPGGFYRS